MPTPHSLRPQRLALAIALALGYIEVSMAQQPETQVTSDASTSSPRKKTAKASGRFDDLLAINEFIGPLVSNAPPANPPTTHGSVRLVTSEPSASAAIEFDDAFYELLEFPEPVASEGAVVLAEVNPFDHFQSEYTTEHTIISAPLENIDGISRKLGDGDDLLIVNKGAQWSGELDGGEGRNGLLLNAADGGIVAKTTRFARLRVAKGTWTLTDSNDFHESAEIQRGAALYNKGEMEGTVYVDEGATYGGYGKLGGLHVDGLLSVTKQLGAPSIRGNLTLTQGATLKYEITSDDTSPTIYVEGIADLGGASLLVSAMPDDSEQNTRHTIISADRVRGEFGRVSNNLAFMTPTLSYTTKAVDLTYARNEVPIVSAATSENGRQIANSLEQAAPASANAASQPQQVSSKTNNAAVNALLGSSKANAAVALEQLAGSSNANLAKATLSSVDPVNGSMLSAMRQLGTHNLRERNNAPRLAAGNEDNGRVWLQALGHGGKLDRDIEPMQHSTKGLLLGADWSIDEEWRLGLMGGTSRTRLDSKELDGDLDSWHLGAYALRQNGPMSLRLGASYSNHDGSTARRIAFTGFSDRPKGSYDASTQQAFAEVGYNLGRANVSIEPFASLGYQRYQRDGYTEKGGAASLKVHKQSQSNMNSTVGLRLAKTDILDNGMRLTPRFSAGWKHTYGDTYTSTRQRLVTGGSNYTVYGVELDRNSLLVDAGLDLGVSANHSVGVGLTGEVGSDSRNHGVMGQWRMAF